MKGISHFVTGVTVASFFPQSVQAAVDGNPLYFILGGAFGLMPDTLDFKFYRFFYRHDVYIDPDPAKPDPQWIADQIAQALDRASESGRTIRLKLNTIRLGVDYWQQYAVRMDGDTQTVQVRFGPVVNTGQVRVIGAPVPTAEVGRAVTRRPFRNTYSVQSTVDIFDGPSYAFQKGADGVTEIHFLPWHRTWSHSLLVGLALSLPVGLWLGWVPALISWLAFSAHALEDQLGHLGSALFWPVNEKRFPGLRTMHATDGFPNFAAVWLCTLLVFWNLYRFAEDPVLVFGLAELLLIGGGVPLLLIGVLRLLRKRLGYSDFVPGDSADEWVEPSSMS